MGGMLMIPNSRLIDDIVDTEFISPRDRKYKSNVSYEIGGVALSDTSNGLLSHVWKACIDGNQIYIKRDDLEQQELILADENITEIDFTFDQNMRPCVCYVSNGQAKLYWFDTQSNDYQTTIFENIKNPRLSLDDKRVFNVENSDIIFAYIKDNTLYYRQQRDRFGIEYLLKEGIQSLRKIGMGKENRFLFMCEVLKNEERLHG